MTKQKSRRIKNRIMQTLLIMLLAAMIVQASQLARAQNAASSSQWGLTFTVQDTSQNNATNVFAPFDTVLLSANVTYRNATQPDILVTFKVQGPSNAANPTNITTVATTNAAGQAESIFRLPADNRVEGSSIGKWQATATIQADNSTLQQCLSFTTQWNLQITSISIQNPQGQNQTIFYPGNTVTVKVAISNIGLSQEANVTLNMLDSTSKAINQTQIQNTQINSGSSVTQVETKLQIPSNANAGEATINVAVYAGTFQNINVPATENRTAYFTIVTNTTPTITPSPTPFFTENAVSLFSWLLVATGLFTFTALFMFLRRKPTSQIGTQMPSLPPAIPTHTTASPPFFPPNTQEQSTQPAATAPEKIINATVISRIPSIYEDLDIPTPESTSPQEQKQKMVNHLAKISSINQRVQTLETELKAEKEQLNKEIGDLNKTLEEQERAVKHYFDTIRQEIAKLNAHQDNDNHDNAITQKKPNQQSNQKTDEN